MNQSTRRDFIKTSALAGFATACLNPMMVSAKGNSKKSAKKLKDGSVILFQGDSITDGNRGRNADPNHIMGHGYAFSIASRIGADCPEKRYQFFNRGISAHKIIDLEKRWQPDTLDLLPDILSILIGVNDSASVVTHWEPEVSVKGYEETYISLLNQTKAVCPNVLFVLGEPFIAPGSRTSEYWEAYVADITLRQAVVKRLAKQYDAVFVGFQEVFNKAFQKAPVDYWIWDGVHPTMAGHELMAREWINQVEKRISF